MSSMEVAINNMIDEVKKPVRSRCWWCCTKGRASVDQADGTDCKELIVERQRLEQMIKDLRDHGEIEEVKDYSGGFAERFSK